jgi:hypothetical protein
MASVTFLREVIGGEVEAGPYKLGPDIISDRTWVGADECEQAFLV